MTSAAGLVAVTGSTGRIGGSVAAQLAERDVPMRLVVRDPSRAPTYDGVVVRQAAYGEREASIAALQGAETLFMVSAAESADRIGEHRAFVDAAVRAGVQRIVYTSFCGAAPDATFLLGRDHWITEQHIQASGLAWTFLRDNLYADFLPRLADSDGVIRGPAGDGKLAAVAQDDVAAFAALVLADAPSHAESAYDLTGPVALTLTEAAEIMSRVTGRPFAYEEETIEEAYASRAGLGAPAWQVDAWVSTYTAIATGEMAGVSGDLERLLGRPATSLEQLLLQA